MKKNVIAVMLSIVMAMGSVSSVPALAAETTVEEEGEAEESDRNDSTADSSKDSLNSDEAAAQEQSDRDAAPKEELSSEDDAYSDVDEESNEDADSSDDAGSEDDTESEDDAGAADDTESEDDAGEADDIESEDHAGAEYEVKENETGAEGSATSASAQPEEGSNTDATRQSAEEAPLTAEQMRAFQEKVMVWKNGDHILIACDSPDDIQIGYSIYPLESDELLQSGTLPWSASSGLYYADVASEALNGLPVKIVLTDGTDQYEEIVSDDVGAVEFSIEESPEDSMEGSSEDSPVDNPQQSEDAEDAASSDENDTDRSEETTSSYENDTDRSENTGNTRALTWNHADRSDGYYVIVRLEDDSVKVYETTENRIDPDYSADNGSDETADDEINEKAANATSVTVAAYRYDPESGRKFFGEAAVYNMSDASADDDATATDESAATAATDESATADATDDATAAATTDGSLVTEEIPGGLSGQNAAKADAEAPTEGTCGENLTWKLESSGTLRISGTGDMTNYRSYSNQAPWYEINNSIKSIVVEEGVTSIGDYAFYSCDATEGISLPNSLVTIGDYAFEFADLPSVVNLPENLKEIGSSAFFCMHGLTQINVPDSVTTLGSEAFRYCFDLETVTLGNGIDTIGYFLFEGDKKLKSVSISGKISYIGDRAFSGCTALERFDIPDGVTMLDNEAFKNCTSLRTVTLPDSLKRINNGCFAGCASLEEITIPESVTTIQENAFMDCASLKKVSLPSRMKEIPAALFKNCKSLSQVTIPDDVRIIGKQAFYGCESLTEMTLPAWLEFIGDEAFMYCFKLRKVVLPEGEYEAGQNIFIECADDLQMYDRNMQPVADADMGDSTAAESDNKGDQTYYTYGTVTNSYLVDEGDRRLRIEFSDGKLIREYFDTSGNLLSRKSIPVELPLFGGFLNGKDGYYLLFGQENKEKDDSKEVLRIVRYSKSWTRQGAASICGENTAIPFDGGSASMTESGGVLYLRTCHEMYSGHQANLTAAIRESDMSVTWIYSVTGSSAVGYVSHSFNQIIRIDGDDVIAVDHGDTYPRGVILFRYAGKAGAESLGMPSYVNVFPFVGGGNYTGASIGALESSPSHYLVAGNSQEQVMNSDNIVRNIFVTATSKRDFSNSGTTVHWVTSYSGKEEDVSTPVMTALPDGRCLLMWTVDDVLNYCFVKADGTPEKKIYTGNGALSDCKPYVKDNAVWWYVTSSSSPVYYYISLDAPGQVHAENEGHTLVLDPTGGSLDSTSIEVKHGSTYGDLPTPDRGTQYEFAGWYTRKNYGTKITSKTAVRVCDSETLYAHWNDRWSFSEESGTLTINDKKVLSDNWDSIAGQVTRIVVGEDVFSLGNRCFDDFPEVKEVVITDSLFSISGIAFEGTKTQDIYYIGTEESWDSLTRGWFSSSGMNIIFVDDIYDLKYASIDSLPDAAYTGAAIRPEPVVVQLGNLLAKDSDYTLSYSKNTAVGTATVKITGKGKYRGSVSRTFKITQASIAKAKVSGLTDAVYTGQAITQAPTVKLGTKTLKAGTDYTVSYVNNVAAGTATVTVTGKGNYTGTVNGTFKITPASIEGATVTGIKNKTYTGKAVTQAPTVQLSSVTLKSGTDYTLSYTNNTAVGTATVKITGKGNYTGTISRTFKITAASIESAEVSGVVDKVYTGQAVTQALTVQWGGVTLQSETDYTVSYSNNTVVGTATVTITGKGNFKGTVSKTFKITAASIAKAKVSGLTDAVYTGQAITQAPTVKLGTKTLKAGTDYTVSYANNTAAGTATVTVTGKGNYSGTVTGTFKITPALIESATVTGIKNKTYTGKAIKQAPTVKVGDITLKSGTDYTLSYANNTAVGTATVTITGKGNYAGTINKTFKITAASIESAEVSGVVDKVYTGQAVTQALTVQLSSVTLKEGTDYTVSYENNTAVGTATVTITGKGNYRGTVSKTFEITRASIEGATVTGIKNKTYTGKAIKQSPVVKVGDTTLKSGTDYKISYSSNVNVGTATVTITGTGSYNGKIVRTFKITAKSITPAVELSETVFTYNGRTQKPDVIVRDGETALTDADYDIIWADDCVGAGVHELTVTLKGNYAGTETETFTILPGKTSRGDMFNLAGNVKVTWKEVPGAKYYKVYREGLTDPEESLEEPVIVTERLIGWDKQPGLTNGNAYRYRIVASLTGRDDPSGDSTLSYSKVMYRLKTVVIRSVKNTEPGKVTVVYDKTTSGDSYVLQYGEREDMVGAKTKVVLGADNTSYVIGGLTKGKTYYISIRVRKKVDGIDYYTTFGVPKKVTITK